MVDRGGTGRWRGDAWSQTMLTLIVEGYLLGLVVSLPVGPVTVNLMRRALNYGFWNATAFGGGSASADLVYISLVYFGVAPLLAEQAWLRIGLWLLGAAWLGWLGVDAVRSALQTQAAGSELDGDGRWRSYLAGVGVTLLNPLTIVSWLALGGGYFSLHPLTQTLQGGLLALVAIVAGLMTHVVVVALVLATGRRWLSPRVVQGLSVAAGGILLLIAIGFLVSAVQGISGSVGI
jgi:threonine/homoserine/homoserine lactone efflux protein